jgi:hypothetical protein
MYVDGNKKYSFLFLKSKLLEVKNITEQGSMLGDFFKWSLFKYISCRTGFVSILIDWRVGAASKVARWFVFKPKTPIWLNFGGSCNGSCWYFL